MSVTAVYAGTAGTQAAGDSKVWVLESCDSLQGVHLECLDNASVATRTENGTAYTYIAGTGRSGSLATVISKTFGPIDVSRYNRNKVYITFKFYIEDVTALTSYGQFEITSSGTSDRGELGWLIKDGYIYSTKLENGWNDIVINLGQGGTPAGVIDYSKLNYFRIYVFLKNPVTLGFDDFKMAVLEDADFKEDFEDQKALEKFTSSSSLSISQGSLKVGAASGENVISASGDNLALATPGLHAIGAKIKADDLSKISSVKFSLGSGGKFSSYEVPLEEMTSGQWYNFTRDLSEYDQRDAGFYDFIEADTLKITVTATAQTDVYIDDVYVQSAAIKIYNKIESIGELTYENHEQKLPLIEEIEQDIEDFLTKSNQKPTFVNSHVMNYFKYLYLQEKCRYYAQAAQNGILMELEMKDNLIKTGDVAEFVIKFNNVGTTYKNYTYEIHFDELHAQTSSLLTGKTNLNAGARREVKFSLVATEGGLCEVYVDLKDLSGKVIATSSCTLIINDKGVYFGDNHTHSTQSDGSHTLADNFLQAINLGNAFIYATDHNATPADLWDVNYAKQVLQLGGYGYFIALKGSEITGFCVINNNDYSLAGHLLYYNGTTYYPEPLFMDVESNVYAYQTIMKQILEEGAYCYMAHPFQGIYRFSVIGEYNQGGAKKINVYTDQTGMELMNGMQRNDKFQDHSLKAVEYWDRMNISGQKKYFGIGNSDAHDKNNLNHSFNGFLLEEYSDVAINNALGSGTFFATSGVEIRFTMDGKDMGQTIIADEEKEVTVKVTARDKTKPITMIKLIKYTMNYSSNPEDSDEGYATRQETIIYHDPQGAQGNYVVTREITVTVRPGEFYRLEATSNTAEEFTKNNTYIRYAFSNPIWIERAATEMELGQDRLTLKVGDKRKLTVSTDNIYDTVLFTSSDPSKVRVEVNGLVTVLEGASGTYTITATTTSGSVTRYCTITVEGTTGGGGEKEEPEEQPGSSGCGGCGGALAGSGALVTAFLAAFAAIKYYTKRREV